MKVYICNYDGLVNRLIATNNMREAAASCGIPYPRFLKYGSETKAPEAVKVAMASPGEVFEAGCIDGKWVKINEKASRDYKVHMRHCNIGEYKGSCKYGTVDCPALASKSISIVDYFDPYKIEHLKAYRHLEKTGFWPERFYPENVEWPLIWQAALTAKMTQAWLEAAENGQINGMPHFDQ